MQIKKWVYIYPAGVEHTEESKRTWYEEAKRVERIATSFTTARHDDILQITYTLPNKAIVVRTQDMALQVPYKLTYTMEA